ncbi:hypothetical protein CBW65_05580 [Tumebacillus avium]|uniref:DUF4352 domain-containing protein n=1 Tax=Tumebacillus avium TaxID=1903704 RepID=A0A1Y0IJC4_9BACL|nr:DUF4352 domain-containing protein [Tumebacillus avium]ARU60611.1 hypothetical protein CBW65_05580 [Tumebacillus avium]
MSKKRKSVFSRWWFAVLIVIVAGAGFFAYKFQDVNQNVVTDPETKVFQMGEAVESGGILTTVTGFHFQKEVEGHGYDDLKENEQFLIVDVAIKNPTDKGIKVHLNNYQIKVDNWTGDIVLPAFKHLNRDNTEFRSQEIAPGKEIKGQFAYKINKERSQSANLRFSIPAYLLEKEAFESKKEVVLKQ